MAISVLQSAAAPAATLSDVSPVVVATTTAPGVGALPSRFDHSHGLSDSGWLSPTLLNGWATYGSPYGGAAMYRKIGNVVFVRGLIANGTVGATYFTLPVGFRPSFRMLFACETNPNVNCRVDVDPNGSINGSGDNNGWVSLGNVVFVADG